MTDDLKRLDLFKTEKPPCSLRFLPSDINVVLLGTYDLNKDTNTRTGSIEIWKFNESKFMKLHTKILNDGAILDLKFDPFDDLKFITCNSIGIITIWKIGLDDYDIELIDNINVFDQDDGEVLITSIEFSTVINGLLTFTGTNGQIGTLNLSNGDKSINVFDTEHDLECWYGTFGCIGGLENVVFSGGDDRKLIGHDLRCQNEIFQTNRIHDAGIVSILTSKGSNKGIGKFLNNGYGLWCGSYDDSLSILDLRVGLNQDLIPGLPPKIIQKLQLGGGVWKLIENPNHDKVLSCNMYDGARILDYSGDEVKVDKYFKGDHESMCYGGDWNDKFIGTCSFYDCIVQIWQP
ncbi:hypothetical protein CANARDRAFT_29040 [[Candida] arabinofermentans NRRL YB-2248]|uniref:Uncharacterized protein n=1 Tax=[Candida] arabinofermentans NRRL YB-2248 TaxID=983967 RepID=A0A1E4SYD6_9ASCO|nr:hypothetical protein CANARDRAFT_29040 [[Candida] arabinofermentans NRRL YB-2248]